jgi:hypothetical protein
MRSRSRARLTGFQAHGRRTPDVFRAGNQGNMPGTTGLGGLTFAVLLTLFAGAKPARAAPQVQTFPLRDTNHLTVVNVKAEAVEYQGRKCVLVTNDTEKDGFALLRGTENFQDGIIEADVAVKISVPPPAFRMPGFVGIGFRARVDASKYELFYWRPGNSVSEDQSMRNHSVQYISVPGFDWYALRYDWPWIYEAYAPLKLETWTKVRLEVSGRTAKLYLNGSQSPSLVVNPLLGPDLRGGVALWGYQNEDAYFSNVRITNSNPLPVKNGSDVSGTWQVKFSSDIGAFNGTLELQRVGDKITGTWSGDFGQSRPVAGTWRDGYVELSFDAQWKFPRLQGHGPATLAGWIDGDSADGRMRVEALTEGRWTATRKQ